MPSNPANKLKPVAGTLRKHDTWAEKLLWKWLRDRRFSAYKFRRQHAFGPYILDFFCVEAFLNIELDGRQHGFPDQQKKDAARDAWLASAGVRTLRFWNTRLRLEQESIRETIWRELQGRAPHPLPEYCRPMVSPSELKSSERLSPSPHPSPSGRGSTIPRLTEISAAGLAEGSSEKSAPVASRSLSPRERFRVRGNDSQTSATASRNQAAKDNFP